MEFEKFAKLVNNRLNSFAGRELYVTAEPDKVWEAYLASFPEGSNPIYKERTEHDCSCCKNFIRGIGNVVAIATDGSLESIWAVTADHPLKAELTLKMEILKHIIAVKLEERKNAVDAALEDLSAEEIQARLEALS